MAPIGNYSETPALAGYSVGLYDKSPLRQVTGDCLRPGGLGLTRHGLDLCAFAPAARILDIGCGPGASLALLKERGHNSIGPGIGLDRSAVLLAEAAHVAPVLLADFAFLPFQAACLDGVLCECVFSLASDKERTLRECRRVLKPKGRLLLSDLVRLEESGGGEREDALPCIAGAVPVEELTALLRACGFVLLHVEDCTPLLRQLAAQLVWRFGSMAAFMELWLNASGEKNGAGNACGMGRNLGYTLIIAEKMEKSS